MTFMTILNHLLPGKYLFSRQFSPDPGGQVRQDCFTKGYAGQKFRQIWQDKVHSFGRPGYYFGEYFFHLLATFGGEH